jgi:hypothetical protein
MSTLFDEKGKAIVSVLAQLELSEDETLNEYLTTTKTANERFSVREVAIALDAAGGFVTYAARLLKCSVSTVRRYIKNYPQLAELQDAINEFRLDTSEVQLFNKVNKGDNTAIIFHLKCKGKKRGYIDNAAINYNVGVDPEKANWKEMMDEVADHLDGGPKADTTTGEDNGGSESD